MSISVGNLNRNWVGLLIDTPRHETDEGILREVLGSESVLLVVRENDSTLESVRRLLKSQASSIVTVMGNRQAPTLTSLLNIAGSLSSFRKIVVLHDASVEGLRPFQDRGILMLRDCPEVREALQTLVAKESGLLRRVPPVRLVGIADSGDERAGVELRAGFVPNPPPALSLAGERPSGSYQKIHVAPV